MMNKTTTEAQQLIKARHKQELLNLVGTIPIENPIIQRTRAHQGWWRAVVMGLPEGEYFDNVNKVWKKVCNRTFEDTTPKDINFLTSEAEQAATITISGRQDSKHGIIEESRLNFNLLSSQPLCFNFFGELMMDKQLGLSVLKIWWPEVTELKRIIFEYAPDERYTNDNSAFDIAFEVSIGQQSGLIGLECKYTDTFSVKEYTKKEYEDIFKASKSFKATYNEFINKKYNQLFRNQLIAEALYQNNKYDVVKTGLFCYQADISAISTAQNFKLMLNDPEIFKVLTYNNFIESVQRLDLNWRQREWTMLLWARFCGMQLSEASIEKWP